MKLTGLHAKSVSIPSIKYRYTLDYRTCELESDDARVDIECSKYKFEVGSNYEMHITKDPIGLFICNSISEYESDSYSVSFREYNTDDLYSNISINELNVLNELSVGDSYSIEFKVERS